MAMSFGLRPLTAVIPVNRPGILLSRTIVATSLRRASAIVAGSEFVPTAESVGDAVTVRGEWVRGVTRTEDDAVILYLHGSAYAICSARTHRAITSHLAEETGLPVFSCDYRLAPTHRFPAAADDVRAAFDWLCAQGYAADRIVVAGDSAGGHLAVDLALQLGREGAAVPAALVLFSPVFDLTMGLAKAREGIRRDPMISATRAARLLAAYTVGADPAHPRLALVPDADLPFPPTLIHAGSREMLAADAEALAQAIQGAGGACELVVWHGQMHVFQALNRILPEARIALRQAGAFITDQLAAGGFASRRGPQLAQEA